MKEDTVTGEIFKEGKWHPPAWESRETNSDAEFLELKEKYNYLIKRIRIISENCFNGFSQIAEEFCHDIAEDENYNLI